MNTGARIITVQPGVYAANPVAGDIPTVFIIQPHERRQPRDYPIRSKNSCIIEALGWLLSWPVRLMTIYHDYECTWKWKCPRAPSRSKRRVNGIEIQSDFETTIATPSTRDSIHFDFENDPR